MPLCKQIQTKLITAVTLLYIFLQCLFARVHDTYWIDLVWNKLLIKVETNNYWPGLEMNLKPEVLTWPATSKLLCKMIYCCLEIWNFSSHYWDIMLSTWREILYIHKPMYYSVHDVLYVIIPTWTLPIITCKWRPEEKREKKLWIEKRNLRENLRKTVLYHSTVGLFA